MRIKPGFTLVELIIVILIVGILAAVAVPMVGGRTEKAKWSEAKAAAGTIKRAVQAYIMETPDAHDFSDIEGDLDTESIYEALGFNAADLDGAYFHQGDYAISNVTASPAGCTVTVTSSHDSGPSGTGALDNDGLWSLSR